LDSLKKQREPKIERKTLGKIGDDYQSPIARERLPYTSRKLVLLNKLNKKERRGKDHRVVVEPGTTRS